jgi:hypothetical protein
VALPAEALGGVVHLRGYAASVESLRRNRQRRLVSLNVASWNQLERWVREVDGFAPSRVTLDFAH